jgi:hypothetical protein|tara:strand:+ start:230 stop:460 length:231 start_codon:yes stop_codon:yes gene_type:complete
MERKMKKVTKKIKDQKIRWGSEDVDMLQLFTELDRCVAEVVRNMYQMDGDMYMSDYQKLCSVQWKIEGTLSLLKEK